MRTCKKYLKLIQEQEEQPINIQNQLIRFFDENPNPSIEQVHNFAFTIGVRPRDVKLQIYMLLTSLLKDRGKYKNIPDENFDQESGI